MFSVYLVCGYTTFLHHNQSLTFSSPEVSGNYLSNVYCKWTILNNQSLWYKVNYLPYIFDISFCKIILLLKNNFDVCRVK